MGFSPYLRSFFGFVTSVIGRSYVFRYFEQVQQRCTIRKEDIRFLADVGETLGPS